MTYFEILGHHPQWEYLGVFVGVDAKLGSCDTWTCILFFLKHANSWHVCGRLYNILKKILCFYM